MPDRRRGLLVDYGGVLTTPVVHSFRAFCEEAGLDRDVASDTILEGYHLPEADSPVHQVETGRVGVEDFAVRLAEALTARSGVVVEPEGLLQRLFARVELDERMVEAVATIRRAGVATALVSNSWGDAGYPRERFAELFDVVVISGEVGLRKPDPAIFQLACERLGVRPVASVFVDDLPTNVAAAEALGMAGVVHREASGTLARLTDLLGLEEDLSEG